MSDQKFGFRTGHSALDVLLLLTQQWMEVFNVRHEIRAISLDTSHAFVALWYPALLSKPSPSKASSTHGFLTSSTLIANVWHHRNPFPVKAGVPQGSILFLVLILIFINDHSDSMKNPLYLFPDDYTLCRDIPNPSDRQAATSYLSSDLEKRNHKLD